MPTFAVSVIRGDGTWGAKFRFSYVSTDACPATPTEVTAPWRLTPSQWWCVLRGVMATAERANLALISAGVAFFGLMAVIPGIAAVVAFVGIFGDPAWIGDQIRALGGVAPDAVVTIIHDQVMRLLSQSNDELAWGALFNLVLALWSAVQGTRWVLMALTAVNRRAEKRRALSRYIAAGMFTLYGLGLSVAAIVLMGIAPLALALLHVESGTEVLLLALRWPVLGWSGYSGLGVIGWDAVQHSGPPF